jgi:hypothetical protein
MLMLIIHVSGQWTTYKMSRKVGHHCLDNFGIDGRRSTIVHVDAVGSWIIVILLIWREKQVKATIV